MKCRQQAIECRAGHDYALVAGLEWFCVLHDKEAVGRNDNILEVTLDINDLSDFLGGAGALIDEGGSGFAGDQGTPTG